MYLKTGFSLVGEIPKLALLHVCDKLVTPLEHLLSSLFIEGTVPALSF